MRFSIGGIAFLLTFLQLSLSLPTPASVGTDAAFLKYGVAVTRDPPNGLYDGCCFKIWWKGTPSSDKVPAIGGSVTDNSITKRDVAAPSDGHVLYQWWQFVAKRAGLYDGCCFKIWWNGTPGAGKVPAIGSSVTDKAIIKRDDAVLSDGHVLYQWWQFVAKRAGLYDGCCFKLWWKGNPPAGKKGLIDVSTGDDSVTKRDTSKELYGQVTYNAMAISPDPEGSVKGNTDISKRSVEEDLYAQYSATPETKPIAKRAGLYDGCCFKLWWKGTPPAGKQPTLEIGDGATPAESDSPVVDRNAFDALYDRESLNAHRTKRSKVVRHLSPQ